MTNIDFELLSSPDCSGILLNKIDRFSRFAAATAVSSTQIVQNRNFEKRYSGKPDWLPITKIERNLWFVMRLWKSYSLDFNKHGAVIGMVCVFQDQRTF